jgi:hypothetical protein
MAAPALTLFDAGDQFQLRIDLEGRIGGHQIVTRKGFWSATTKTIDSTM